MSATTAEVTPTTWRHPLNLRRIFADENSVVMFVMVVSMLLSGWISFSLFNRATPGSDGGMDIIALAKLGVRCLVMMTFGFLMLRLHTKTRWSRWGVTSSAKALRMREISRRSVVMLSTLMPWILYAGWGFVSVLWSPLKSISFGQSLGLLTMICLSWMVGVYCDTAKRRDAVVRWLGYMLLGFSLFVIACYVIVPEQSGMMREYSEFGSVGIIHPTIAGSNASLGLVLATWTCLHLSLADSQSRRCRIQLALVIAIHSIALLISHSRTPLGLAVVTVAIAMAWRLSLRAAGLWLITLALMSMAYVVFDPGFTLLNSVLGVGGEFLARGQSSAELKQVSGRAEMWHAIWAQFLTSIWLGHGYFVTSATGQLNVWHGPFNYTAHNIYLQLLVTTGLIGTGIFAFGSIRVIRRIDWLGRDVDVAAERALRRSDSATMFDFDFIRSLAILLIIWFAIWTLTCESFIGPVRTESVVFFAMVGLLLSARRPTAKPVVLSLSRTSGNDA